MEEGGFEPPKSVTTDLQSAPFGRSGTPPYEIGAGGRIRTPDLLITNQLLYRLSYTSKYISNSRIHNTRHLHICQQLFLVFLVFMRRDLLATSPAPLSAAATPVLYLLRRRNRVRRGILGLQRQSHLRRLPASLCPSRIRPLLRNPRKGVFP